ncbi:hypothetical protein OCE25_26925 [Bacillus cereus]|nr:hypothetical protein [Bacillus cereus]
MKGSEIMYKIYHVEKGSNVEAIVNRLINEGFRYIPLFEEKMGIVDFCIDLEVISDGIIDPNLFLIMKFVSGQKCYQNKNLKEITAEQFKNSVQKGYSVSCAGSKRMLQSIGYNINNFNEYLNEIELVS